MVTFDDVDYANNQYVVVEVESEEFGLERDELVVALQAENVLVRRYFYPGCHLLEPYRSRNITLPITETVAEKVLCLPSGSEISAEDIIGIADLLVFLHRNSEHIKVQSNSVSSDAAVD